MSVQYSCMLIQTIYKNGNSLAVTIPQQYLKELDLKEGSEIVVEKENDTIRITPKKKVLAPDVDAKFMKMVDLFIKEHEDVLRELAQK